MANSKFYGYEVATMPAIHPIYRGITTPRDMYEALCNVWSAQTYAPRLRHLFCKDNLTVGQCSITAFLVQDVFGGEVYGVPLEEGGVHCFNVVDGKAFDLTDAQFGGKVLDYTLQYPQTRDRQLADPDKYARYRLLCEGLDRFVEAQ